MIDKARLPDLMESIGEEGYFSGEPVLVVLSKIEGEYTVVEGNRRLSAVMLLHNPSLATIKTNSIAQLSDNAKHKPPSKLPVIKYDSKKEILDYLGFRHITGVNTWDSLAKARYLRDLYNDLHEKPEDEKCRELAKIIGIGSRTDYVKKLLCASNIYKIVKDEDYFKIKGLEDSISFSLITTALGYRKIQKFLGLESIENIEPVGLNTDRLEELTKWMFDKSEGNTRLGESRNLKELADIVDNEVALKEFRKGAPLEAAFHFSEGARESVINSIMEALKYLELAYRYAKEVTLGEIEHGQLEEIKKTANAIRKQTTPTDD